MIFLKHALISIALVGSTSAFLAVTPIHAGTPTRDLCEALAAQVSADAGLPVGLLASISRIESGRSVNKAPVKAWPWTLNQAGKGMYFDSRKEALAYLRKAVAGGVRNIDVGCMQINYRWHGKQFASLEDMMDPVKNVAYGARYLSELYRAHGNWETAASYYHSSESARGKRYFAKVARVWKSIASVPAAAVVAASGVESLQELGTVVAYVAAGGMQRATAAYDRLTKNLPANAHPRFDLKNSRPSKADEVPLVLQRNWDKVRAFREGFKPAG